MFPVLIIGPAGMTLMLERVGGDYLEIPPVREVLDKRVIQAEGGVPELTTTVLLQPGNL